MTKYKEKWCESLCCSGTGVSIPQRSWSWLRFTSIVIIFFLLWFDIKNWYCDNVSSGYCQMRRSGGYLWFRVREAAGGIIQDLSHYPKSILLSLQSHFPWPCRRGLWRRISSSVLEDAGQVLNAHKNLGESPRPRRWLRSLWRRTRLVGGLPRMG